MFFNWRKIVITKKGYRYFMNIPRFFISNFSGTKRAPKIICNSFPKSGTYLLFSILGSIPGVRDWGYFIASKPSFTYKEKSPEKISQKIGFIVPMEIVGTHIYYYDEVYKTLLKNNCIMFFIYRDPRDVVISEANYLYDMNRFHRLHKYFKKYPDLKDRIMFSIKGKEFHKTPFQYMNIKERFNKYMGWTNCENVLSIKYEQLITQNKDKYIYDILQFYKEHSNNINDFEIDNIIKSALYNSDPVNSHTFRIGGTHKWKKYFNEEHKKVFKDIASDLLIELGYEEDDNW